MNEKIYTIETFTVILMYFFCYYVASNGKYKIIVYCSIIFSVVFWAIFEQAGGSLSLYAAEHVNSNLMGVNGIDPNMVNNSANSLFVIIFAPIVGLIWLALAKKKVEPNGVVKFGIGFLLLGAAFYIFYSGQFFTVSSGIASLNVFTLGYFVVTFGELALSPIGLSLMTKLAPLRLQGFMMGMWFLASAYGQYVAGLFGAGISPSENATAAEKLAVYSQGYQQFALYAVIAGVILIAISPLIRKLMQDVK